MLNTNYNQSFYRFLSTARNFLLKIIIAAPSKTHTDNILNLAAALLLIYGRKETYFVWRQEHKGLFSTLFVALVHM